MVLSDRRATSISTATGLFSDARLSPVIDRRIQPAHVSTQKPTPHPGRSPQDHSPRSPIPATLLLASSPSAMPSPQCLHGISHQKSHSRVSTERSLQSERELYSLTSPWTRGLAMGYLTWFPLVGEMSDFFVPTQLFPQDRSLSPPVRQVSASV